MKDSMLVDISKERIKMLFQLACNAEDIDLSRRYIAIMEKVAMRMNITIERNIKLLYCKKCKSPYKGIGLKLKNKTITVKCPYCGDIRHIPIEKNQSNVSISK
ncbi:MAG: ribonuclease P [Ferroplasma sp.]